MFQTRRIVPLLIAAACLAPTALAANAGNLSAPLQKLAAARAHPPRTANAFGAPRISPSGLVEVYVHYAPETGPGTSLLRQLGARRILVSPELGVVQAWVPISSLHALAARAGVNRVSLPAYGYVKRYLGRPAADVASGLDIDQEGIAGLRVQPLQDNGVLGAGVRVGVISNGVAGLAASQQAGYLPGNVYVDPNTQQSGAEGTAMLEEVHAMAPQAQLGFCAGATTAAFITCLNDLYNQFNADIIVDDLGYFSAFIFNEPDGTSFLDAIDQYVTNHPDVNLVTAAGNDAQDYFQHAYIANTSPNIISLDPSYTPGPGQAGGRTYQSAMDFGAAINPSNSDTTEPVAILPTSLNPGIALNAILTWDDPAAGPYDDLDLFLVQQDGTVVASSTYDQTGGPNADIGDGEYIYYQNTTGSTQTLYLAALCYSCAHPILIKLTGFLDGGGSFQYLTQGGINGHAGLAGELTTGAAQFVSNSGGTVTATMESFSDSGPYTYGDWQSGTQTTDKPNLVGIDGVTVSGAGGFPSPFYGTSAAAPNVASIIALLRGVLPQGEPDAAGWANAFETNANPGALNSTDQNVIGSGLGDAEATAIAFDGGPLTAQITSPATSPIDVDPDVAVTFAGDCAYTGPFNLAYDWNFGKDSGIPDAHTAAPAPVAYANGGVYDALFKCSDVLQSASDQVSVRVHAAAVAHNLSVRTLNTKNVTGQLLGSRVGGNEVTYEITAPPARGTLALDSGTGVFTYTPPVGYAGKDSFRFAIDNGVMTSNVATVTVTVTRPGTSSGGGGFAMFGLLGLAGLVALRRRR